MPPAVAVRGFLDALGVEDAPSDPHAQVALYRSLTARRRLLVVLDNAGEAAQVEPLLPGGAGCVVLVTSRDRLTPLVIRHGARHRRLGVLDDPASRALLVARVGADRVAAEPAAVRRIMDRCGGLPLALAIVAGRAQVDPAAPLARVADELAGFTDRDPTTSLPAVLSWSLRALTAPQVRVLGLLAAAPGPDIGPPAVASLPGAEAELPVLERVSLLERDATGRYRMHDLVRTHVQVADPAATRRVIDHYLHTAHSADQHLYPLATPAAPPPPSPGCHPGHPADVAEALAWFDAEHRCLLAAVDMAADHAWPDVVWHLARCLTTYHHRRDRPDADLRTWRLALRGATAEYARMVAHRRLGEAFARTGRDGEALAHLRRAVALAEQLGDRRQLAHAHRSIAWACGRQDQDATALAHAEVNLRLCRELDDPVSQAHALNATAWFTARLGDLDRARSLGESALASRPNPEAAASTRETLGYIEFHANRPEQSVAHYRQALTLRRAHGYLRHVVNTLERMVGPLTAAGHHEEAEAAAREAAELSNRLRTGR
ncbi:tetratricopeptide repeat protein [Actinokineospora sp. NBRC 105648]|uniref:tetratricopeptide repeat protein n=1 Tax=Actinokineospora sp. NBRC 105648 TaxID=3032206 RepID=UPI0025556727|nr:tetratricopeptide repeat protein [Actinokineospora sp. NBRC 105648]